ncbi:MAG TPA: hypothetical protein VJB70_00965 [Candidatus Paceibacterota bacterium]
MSQKIFIVIIGVLALLVLGLFGAAFFIARDTGVPTGEVLRDILPFGGSSIDAPVGSGLAPTPRAEDASDNLTQTPTGSLLQQITMQPIAGATTYMLPTDKTTRVLYVEKSTGNVFSYDPKTRIAQRITNTTIPGIQEVIWGKDRVILRYLDENDVIKSWSSALTSSMIEAGSAQRLEGSFLSDDIQSIVPSPNKSQIFYLSLASNSIVGAVTNFSGENKKQVFESTFTEWSPQWSGERTVALTSKPSAGIGGHLFFLNISTGVLQSTLGNLPGLVTKTSSGELYVAFSVNDKNESPQLHIYNKKKESSAPLPLVTFPDKCAWSVLDEEILYCGVPDSFPRAAYPDSWYQGIFSSTDSLWKINAVSGATEIIAIPTQVAQKEMDVENPFLDKNEEYLLFTNKKDSSLWSLKLR